MEELIQRQGNQKRWSLGVITKICSPHEAIQGRDLNVTPRLGHKKSTGKYGTLVGYRLDLFIFPGFYKANDFCRSPSTGRKRDSVMMSINKNYSKFGQNAKDRCLVFSMSYRGSGPCRDQANACSLIHSYSEVICYLADFSS